MLILSHFNTHGVYVDYVAYVSIVYVNYFIYFYKLTQTIINLHNLTLIHIPWPFFGDESRTGAERFRQGLGDSGQAGTGHSRWCQGAVNQNLQMDC
jgi:hypothetical protein